jgi:hypothetical protein
MIEGIQPSSRLADSSASTTDCCLTRLDDGLQGLLLRSARGQTSRLMVGSAGRARPQRLGLPVDSDRPTARFAQLPQPTTNWRRELQTCCLIRPAPAARLSGHRRTDRLAVVPDLLLLCSAAAAWMDGWTSRPVAASLDIHTEFFSRNTRFFSKP